MCGRGPRCAARCGLRAFGPLTAKESKACANYHESLDMEKLKKALDVKTDSAALNTLKRYMEEG